jgi:drug/metabolite transporter (DMT)-like permease
VDPQTAVVVLGLASAAAWGSADFGGGLAGRRAPFFGVLLFSQLVGCALALSVAALRRETVPVVPDLAVALLAGVIGAIGLGALYRGLQVGRMGVVAPISGALAAVVPVTAGMVFQGVPGPAVLIGIGLAIVAVILVSVTPVGSHVEHGPRIAGIPRDVAIALVAGFALGAFNLVISRLSPGAVYAPLVVVRATEAIVIGAVILLARRTWRLPRRVWPLVAVVGGLDMAGNGFFILAAQAGRLDVAAVLSSLYPVTTLILAAIVLRERVVGVHALGVAAAIAAIVLVRIG